MILVTGASGFLGAELVVQLLQTHFKVRCIKRKTSIIPAQLKPFAEKIEWLDADILDFADLEEAFDGVTHVYHCAAVISFSKDKEAVMKAINVTGTANVVNLCNAYAIKKLVHVSSIAALGNPKAGELTTEKDFWDAYDKNGTYALTKYQAEMEVW